MQTLSDGGEEFVSELLGKIQNKEELTTNDFMFIERCLRVQIFWDDILNELLGISEHKVKLYDNNEKLNLSYESEQEITKILDISLSLNHSRYQKRAIEQGLRLYYYNEEILDSQLHLTKYPTNTIYKREKKDEKKT